MKVTNQNRSARDLCKVPWSTLLKVAEIHSGRASLPGNSSLEAQWRTRSLTPCEEAAPASSSPGQTASATFKTNSEEIESATAPDIQVFLDVPMASVDDQLLKATGSSSAPAALGH